MDEPSEVALNIDRKCYSRIIILSGGFGSLGVPIWVLHGPKAVQQHFR